MDYLVGSIYHMVHFDNLQSILQRRALLSKERVLEEAIEYQSIAYENVQSLRDRIFIWDVSQKAFRGLHSYVPFYFATLTPMLFVQYRNGIQDQIVVFEVGRSVLKEQGVLFTATSRLPTSDRTKAGALRKRNQRRTVSNLQSLGCPTDLEE